MSRISLTKLLSEKSGFASALAALIGTLGSRWSIRGSKGQALIGESDTDAPRHRISHREETLGWVVGRDADALAHLLSALVEEEAEKIALADEVLEKYREINLLYNLTEKLSASLDLNEIAGIALAESCRLIRATAGRVRLLDDDGSTMEIAAFGDDLSRHTDDASEAIMRRSLESARGDILNADSDSSASFLVAPLKTKGRVSGAILLASQTTTFDAADLKLLMTVASQAAPPLENALLHERTLRAAREREERLRKQIEQLQIQIDQARTAKQVAEITETDYFQMLRQKADRLRYGAEESLE